MCISSYSYLKSKQIRVFKISIKNFKGFRNVWKSIETSGDSSYFDPSQIPWNFQWKFLIFHSTRTSRILHITCSVTSLPVWLCMLRVSLGQRARLYTLALPSNKAHSLCICHITHRTGVDFSYQTTFKILQAFHYELAATQIHHSKAHCEILAYQIAQMFYVVAEHTYCLWNRLSLLRALILANVPQTLGNGPRSDDSWWKWQVTLVTMAHELAPSSFIQLSSNLHQSIAKECLLH